MTTTKRPGYTPTSARQKLLFIFLLAGGLWGLHYLSPPSEPLVVPLTGATGKRVPSLPAQGRVPAPPPAPPGVTG